MNASNDLFQIAGFFEKYAQTGGVVSPQEAQFLSSHLSALGERVRALQLAFKGLGDEFDAYLTKHGAVVDKRPVRAFSLIEGGQA
jgi:hypothetical protein